MEKRMETYEDHNNPQGNLRLIDVEKFRNKGIYPPNWFS